MAQKIAHGVHSMDDGSIITFPYDDAFDWSRRGFIPPNVAIHQVDIAAVQQFPIGTKLVRDDSVYRYCEYGGTTAAGDIIQAEAPDGAHDDGDWGVNAIGTTSLTATTSLTLIENEYAGGFMCVENDTGEGYLYRVLSNTAVAGAVGGVIVLQAPGLAVATDATSDVKLVKSRFQEVIQMPTTVTGMLVGAGLGVGANGSFGWVQTRGPAAVLTDGTVVIGQHVRASDGTAGVEPLVRAGTAEDEAEVGYVMDVGPTGEYSIIFLTLE